jgi:hypothetical protein
MNISPDILDLVCQKNIFASMISLLGLKLISMTVQRGNATIIMGTLGPLRKLGDFFDVISPPEEES